MEEKERQKDFSSGMVADKRGRRAEVCSKVTPAWIESGPGQVAEAYGVGGKIMKLLIRTILEYMFCFGKGWERE